MAKSLKSLLAKKDILEVNFSLRSLQEANPVACVPSEGPPGHERHRVRLSDCCCQYITSSKPLSPLPPNNWSPCSQNIGSGEDLLKLQLEHGTVLLKDMTVSLVLLPSFQGQRLCPEPSTPLTHFMSQGLCIYCRDIILHIVS